MWKLWKRASSEREESIETRLRQLEADFKTLELEWNEVYQKVRKALGRVTKTEALEHPKNEALTGPSADPMLVREQILRLAKRHGA